MRIIVDTNIVFSAILNSNSKIARIIFQPKTSLNFYSTTKLLEEIKEHKIKIKAITKLSDEELDRIITLITNKIRFINYNLIPIEIVALTEHIKGKFWTGDKVLIKGLQKKNWNKFINIDELQLKIKK